MASGLSSPMTAGPSSPMTAGLSSPMTAGLSSPVSTMKDINRDKPIEKTTLDSQKEDDARWIERAGWAPRFGNLTSYSCLEENLANEQTWIEGKLDEKFFGGKSNNH